MIRVVQHVKTNLPIIFIVSKTQNESIAIAKNKTGTRKVIKYDGTILTFSGTKETTIERPKKLPYFFEYHASTRTAKAIGISL